MLTIFLQSFQTMKPTELDLSALLPRLLLEALHLELKLVLGMIPLEDVVNLSHLSASL